MPGGAVQLVVGRVAQAHGVGGEVSVEVRTDAADLRFAPGTSLDTDPADRGPLTVERARWHSGRLLVAFTGVTERTAAEGAAWHAARRRLVDQPALDDDDEYWDHDLIGLHAVTVAGVGLGQVEEVLHPPGADLLSIRGADGRELLVPFVRAIVPAVDLDARRLVVDPPEGLLEL